MTWCEPQVLGPIIGVVGIAVGYVIRWYIVDKQGLRLAHKHRLIEEHTKRLHEYVELYYLKLISRARWLAESLDKIVKRKTLKSRASVQKLEEELELSFFDLARFQSMYHQWGKKAGHIVMLKDSTAELLIGALYVKAESQLVSSNRLVSLEDDAILRREIAPDELFVDFKDKLKKEPLKGVFIRYKSWIDMEDASLASLVKWLRCYSELFLFEINTCYKGWFEKGEIMKPTPKTVKADAKHLLHELLESGLITPKDEHRYLAKIGVPKPSAWAKIKRKLKKYLPGTSRSVHNHNSHSDTLHLSLMSFAFVALTIMINTLPFFLS